MRLSLIEFLMLPWKSIEEWWEWSGDSWFQYLNAFFLLIGMAVGVSPFFIALTATTGSYLAGIGLANTSDPQLAWCVHFATTGHPLSWFAGSLAAFIVWPLVPKLVMAMAAVKYQFDVIDP